MLMQDMCQLSDFDAIGIYVVVVSRLRPSLNDIK